MSIASTRTCSNTHEAWFLAPETHQRAGGRGAAGSLPRSGVPP
jgi:hypothetical protein